MIVTAQSEPVLSASGAPLAAPVHAVQGVPVDGLIAASDRLEGWWTLRYGGWTLLTPRGGRLDLSELERACFLCLLRNRGASCCGPSWWPCGSTPRCAR